jgi:hypothetical protein
MAAREREFPFPFWGHAYGTSDIVEVYVWFTETPAPRPYRDVARTLASGLAFIHPVSADQDAFASGPVMQHGGIMDHEIKHGSTTDPHFVPILAQLDEALYGVERARLTERQQVALAFHAAAEQNLRRLHKKHSIAFAVRESGARDRFTRWHASSLERFGEALPHLERYLAQAPPAAIGRPDDEGTRYWPAPWLGALVHLARYQLAAANIATLSAEERQRFGALLRRAVECCRIEPAWAPHQNTALAADLREARAALESFADKLAASVTSAPDQPRDAAEVLSRICREAGQLEFTRIKLGECPTFTALAKGTDGHLQCAVVRAACAAIVRSVDQLRGRPGEIVLTVKPEDQQRLDVLEKIVKELLRKKHTFTLDQSVSLLELLASGETRLGPWLPVEALVEKLRQSIAAHGISPALRKAHAALLAAPYALRSQGRPSEYRPLFAKLL